MKQENEFVENTQVENTQKLSEKSRWETFSKSFLQAEKGFLFMLTQQGRQNTKTTMLFIMLTVALSTIALFVYANNPINYNAGCDIACYKDSDCNDDPGTTDKCNNGGTCNSQCTNINIAQPNSSPTETSTIENHNQEANKGNWKKIKNRYKVQKHETDIEIGNEKADYFEPSVKFTKWNGENYLKLTMNETGFETSSLSGKKIKTENSKKGLSIYTVESGLKFIITFKTKPLTNTYSFDINGWEEFDFFYQTPLSEEFGEMEEYVGDDGDIWIRPANYASLDSYSERPLDVDGSYAVYHKTKRDQVIGEVDYETGKFMHILVPKATDAGGNVSWTEIFIKDGTYTVTIPQKFLDEANYPIKINDTFGYTGIPLTGGTSTVGTFYSNGYSAPENGSATAMHLWTKSDLSSKLTMGLYNDDSGPSSKLRDTEEVDFPSVASDVAATLDTPLDITSGTIYHLAYMAGGESAKQIYDTGTDVDLYYKTGQQYVSGTLPASISSPSFVSGRRYGFYVTYTPSAADSCSCPSSGHWEITSGDVCTLSTECSLSGGDLHIVDGSLTIVNGVTLDIPTGYKIIIDKASGSKLIVEKGGKVVIEK